MVQPFKMFLKHPWCKNVSTLEDFNSTSCISYMVNGQKANCAIMSVFDYHWMNLTFFELAFVRVWNSNAYVLQYKNIGKIITLYMASSVVGLIFICILASNSILEDVFLYIFSNWLNWFEFLSSVTPRYSYLSVLTIFWLVILVSIILADFWWLPKSTNSVFNHCEWRLVAFKILYTYCML